MNTNPNNTIDTNLLRQIGFIAVILFLGIVLTRELWFFLSAFLGSITFYVLMRSRMFYLTEKKRLEALHRRLGADAAVLFCDLSSDWIIGQHHVCKNQLCGDALVRTAG